MSKRLLNLLLTVAVMLAGLLAPSPCPAETAERGHAEALNIGKLRFGIKQQELMLEQSAQEERSLLDELQQMEEKIAVHKGKVDEFKEKIRQQEQVLAAKERELASLMESNEALRQHLLKRLKAFYIMGRTGFLNVTFSGKPLPDLLLTLDGFHSLITYDQALFKTYRESLTTLQRTRQSSELEKGVLENFLADADKENAALQQAAEEKQRMLQRVQTQKDLYEQALKEMRKAENRLASTLATTTRTNGQKGQGFQLTKGKLSPPVWGEVVSRFRDSSANDGDMTFANGISIATGERTEVYAVYEGTVLFADTMRGYGKMIIIDHEGQYFTVYARLDAIRVRQGDPITQGQIIGTTGSTDTLFGSGLYFEIRHDAVAEDPLLWLKPGSLAQP